MSRRLSPLPLPLRTRTPASSVIGGGDIHSMHPENYLATTKMPTLCLSECVPLILMDLKPPKYFQALSNSN